MDPKGACMEGDKVEVAHLSGPEGIRAAFEVLRGQHAGGAGVSASPAEDGEGELPTTVEEVPRIRWTCQKCAAENDGDCETCWNCGGPRCASRQ